MVLLSVFGSQSESPEEYLSWFMANVFSIGITAAIILGFRFLWFSFFENFVFPLWAVFVVSILVGANKSYLTGLYVLWANGSDSLEQGLVNIIIGGAVSAGAALPLVAMITVLLKRFNEERKLLLTAKSLNKLKGLSEKEKTKLSGLAKTLRKLIDDLENQTQSTKAVSIDLIRDLVDRHVRPLAGDLFTELDKNSQSFRVLPLFSSAIRKPPSAIIPALFLLLVIPRTVVWFGPQTGTLAVFGLSILIFLSVSLTNAIIIKPSPVSFFSIAVLLPLTIIMGVTVVTNALPGELWAIPIVVLVWFGQLSVLVNMARVALETANANRQEVRKLLGTDGLSEYAVLRKQRRELANQIHGEVQSRLMNLVLQAEGGKSLNRSLTIQELRNVTELIESGPTENLSFQESLTKLSKTWSGFAKIEYNINQEIDPEQERLIFMLIEEGVSNAFKHGLANKVTVELKDNQIVIIDNGIGPTTGPTGLGSKLIDSSTQAWSLKPAEKGGSRLEMVL